MRRREQAPDPTTQQPCGFVWFHAGLLEGEGTAIEQPCHPDDRPCDSRYQHSHGRCRCGRRWVDHPGALKAVV